jgi:LysM repeat protein
MAFRARIVPITFLFGLLAACQVPVDNAVQITGTLQPYASATATLTSTPPVPLQGTELPLGPTPTPFVHIVQQGETLLGIALRYGVPLEDLLLVNPGVDPGFLTIGQQLRIPGSEGEAVDYLLPTPTPVPLDLGSVRCYDAASGRMVCLLEVSNSTETNLEGIAVVVKLFDERGELIEAKLANSPLDLLPVGEAMPISAAFESRPLDFAYASAELNSAIAVPEDQVELIPLELEIVKREQAPETGFVHVEGYVLNLENIQIKDFQVRILGIARADNGVVVGYNVWESPDIRSEGIELPFSLDIFSLGPSIGHIDLRAEARTIDSVAAE